MRLRLNGWQRAWVLLTGLWGVLMWLVAYASPDVTTDKVFWLWAIPAAVLYALGWSVGWVRRGFKQPG